MDRRQLFGENITGTIIRLVLLSIVVGIVFSALDINLFNIVERFQLLMRLRRLALGVQIFLARCRGGDPDLADRAAGKAQQPASVINEPAACSPILGRGGR
jgi:hypothetical protein